MYGMWSRRFITVSGISTMNFISNSWTYFSLCVCVSVWTDSSMQVLDWLILCLLWNVLKQYIDIQLICFQRNKSSEHRISRKWLHGSTATIFQTYSECVCVYDGIHSVGVRLPWEWTFQCFVKRVLPANIFISLYACISRNRLQNVYIHQLNQGWIICVVVFFFSSFHWFYLSRLLTHFLGACFYWCYCYCCCCCVSKQNDWIEWHETQFAVLSKRLHWKLNWKSTSSHSASVSIYLIYLP